MAVVLSDELIEAVRELQALRIQQSQMRARENKLREQLMLALGEELRGITASGTPAVHVEIQHRRKIDRGRLEAMFPEVFDKVFEEAISAVLKVDLVPETVG